MFLHQQVLIRGHGGHQLQLCIQVSSTADFTLVPLKEQLVGLTSLEAGCPGAKCTPWHVLASHGTCSYTLNLPNDSLQSHSFVSGSGLVSNFHFGHTPIGQGVCLAGPPLLPLPLSLLLCLLMVHRYIWRQAVDNLTMNLRSSEVFS